MELMITTLTGKKVKCRYFMRRKMDSLNQSDYLENYDTKEKHCTCFRITMRSCIAFNVTSLVLVDIEWATSYLMWCY